MIRILVWIAGVAFLFGVAVSALNRLGDHVARVGTLGDGREAFTAIGFAMAFAAIFAALLAGTVWVARRIDSRWVFVIGVATTILVRGVLSMAIDAALVSDWLAYHNIANEIVADGPRFGDIPIGYPILLAGLYLVIGPHVWAAEGLNVVIAGITSALLFDVLRRSAGPTAAAVGLNIYAAMPSLVLMSPVLGTEPIYTLALLAPIWILTVLPGLLRRRTDSTRAALEAATAAGAALGLSQYVRASSMVLLPAFVIGVLVLTHPSHGPRRAAAALVVAFFAILAPVIVDNATRYNQLSVATSSYGGYSILVGTNQTHGGFYNLDDVRLLHSQPGDTLREQSDAAGRVGLRRIADDPFGFAALAYRKFVTMWGEDGYGVFFGLEWEHDPPLAPGMLLAGYLASAIAWAFVAAAGLLGVLRSGPRLPAWLFVGVLVAGSLAALHLVVEIQPRYHAYVTPILIGAAAIGVAGVQRTPAREQV